MNATSKLTKDVKAILGKNDWTSPALIVTGRDAIAIKAGVTFAGLTFKADTPLPVMPDMMPGADYVVTLSGDALGIEFTCKMPVGDTILGGFHFAPGGNASARSGGDATPAINPWSVWDVAFRPACADPRGMFLNEPHTGREWVDIYKLGKDHLANGTSRYGVTIADGNDPPQNPAGGYFDNLDYATAVAVMKHHGKTLLSFDSFRAAAHGVTEKTALGSDPKLTGLDAPRTSGRGMMQATGSLWDWGHDGDPDDPRAALFGGSWRGGGDAGSRFAYVAYVFPATSVDDLGARGRGDHLQLG